MSKKTAIAISLALAIVAAAFLFRSRTRHEARETAQRIAKVPSLTAAVVPAKATLPPGPSAGANQLVDLRKAIKTGTDRLEQRPMDPDKCYADPITVIRKVRVCKAVSKRRGKPAPAPKCHIEKQRQTQAVIGMRRCVGDYLLAVVAPNGKVAFVEAYEKRDSFPSGYKVEVEDGAKRRGVNVPFRVIAPPDRTVIGLKTAVFTKGGGAEEAVYVPYSTALDTPLIREAGLRYLEHIAKTALGELRGQKVRSKFHEGKLVADTVEVQHLVTLVLTEQMKDASLFVRGSDAERLAMINRTLTILGGNLEDSYGYTKSRVGAAGIAQLMAGTYNRLRAQYPKANLPRDQDARLDHGVAMNAMVLHADSEWWAVKDMDYKAFLLANHGARRLMLAAGYNASAGTVMKAIKACGQHWRETLCAQLPKETRWYLVKYETIWEMLYPIQSAPAEDPLVANP